MRRGEELERMFGVTNEQLEECEEAAARGELPGEPVGEIIVGRSFEPDGLQFVGFEAAPQEVAAMDERAAELGMSRSDYLRSLVRKDLAAS